MSTATMTTKGQLTVPADIRVKFGLRAGEKVDFTVNAAGDLVLRPRTGDIRALRGLIAYDGPPISIETINAAIGEAGAETFRRSLS